MESVERDLYRGSTIRENSSVSKIFKKEGITEYLRVRREVPSCDSEMTNVPNLYCKSCHHSLGKGRETEQKSKIIKGHEDQVLRVQYYT